MNKQTENQTIKQVIADQQAQMQEDIDCILDGIDNKYLDNVCQVIVDRCKIIEKATKEQRYGFACPECGDSMRDTMREIASSGLPYCSDCYQECEMA